MYPTISHLLYDLLGIKIKLPIQTFGFWVAIAFVLAAWIIGKELKRKEIEGFLTPIKVKTIVGDSLSIKDILNSSIFGFLIGFKGFEALINYSYFVDNPQEVILSLKGNLYGGILVACISIYIRWKENKKNRLETPKEIKKIIHPYELIGNMTLIAAISGIIGAKIFHNLENLDTFLADPVGQLLSFSGLTFYGGLIAGAISVIFYAKKYKINIRHLTDCFAPGLILAYGIGRIGCHMSGDGDWGIYNLKPKPEWMNFLPDWLWSYDYSHNVLTSNPAQETVIDGSMTYIEGCADTFWDPYCYHLTNPVYPTAIYETIMSLIIFSLLWKVRRKLLVPGSLFSIYLIFNGIERFIIEQIRVNNEYKILGGITQAEMISIVLIIVGALGFLYLKRKYKTSTSDSAQQSSLKQDIL